VIHFYELASIEAKQRLRLLRRSELRIDELLEYVRPIISAVRERGDAALLEFTANFDHVQVPLERLRVSQ
jgi:histidinol dehydrogenase